MAAVTGLAVNVIHLSIVMVPLAPRTSISPPSKRSCIGETGVQSRTKIELVCTRSWYTSHRLDHAVLP
ncbi:hypothetical protein NFJ02_23g51680 [Pycnococcus provasolii]